MTRSFGCKQTSTFLDYSEEVSNCELATKKIKIAESPSTRSSCNLASQTGIGRKNSVTYESSDIFLPEHRTLPVTDNLFNSSCNTADPSETTNFYRSKQEFKFISNGYVQKSEEPSSYQPVPRTPTKSKMQSHSTSKSNQKLNSLASTEKQKMPILSKLSSSNIAMYNSSVHLIQERSGIKSSMRNFSRMVCQKLEEINVTTYNEISENLIQEFSLIDARTDQKNIRRRVYDVLNVLHSTGIIEKDKRQIRWIGYPTNVTNYADKFEMERAALERRLQEKRKALQMYLQRFVSLHRLIQRNKSHEYNQSNVDCGHLLNACSNVNVSTHDKLLLPFILISAPKDCRIDCEMLEDRSQYFFEFDMPFAIHEDIEVLKMLGLDKVSCHELLSILSSSLAKYYPENLVV